jgi:hypothetical protein
MFMKLFAYFLTMIQLPINCVLMGLIIYFMFQVQINHMWFLKKSKWVKSYMLLLSILYVVLVFPKIVYTIVSFHIVKWWSSLILKKTPAKLKLRQIEFTCDLGDYKIIVECFTITTLFKFVIPSTFETMYLLAIWKAHMLVVFREDWEIMCEHSLFFIPNCVSLVASIFC